MKRSGIYVPEAVFECWEIYARHRGGRMSRNNVIEELTLYVLCPSLLTVIPEVVERACIAAREEIERRDLGKVSDGDW